MDSLIRRRDFVLAGGLAAGVIRAAETRRGILNFNENMEYRRLGKTGLMVSAVCLGGHWKRIHSLIPGVQKNQIYKPEFLASREFRENRHSVVSRCIENGINYIDACSGQEVMAYSAALKGRRDQMFLGYSWYEKEMRFAEWRTSAKLLQSLDEGLKAAGLDYVDLWRITCFEPGGQHSFDDSEAVATALDKAKQQGKIRFGGVSSHDRRWLKMMIEQYPQQMDVILTPYTADSKVLPKESLFETVQRFGVGVFGIKPFASNALFQGDSAPGNEKEDGDDQRARLALRYVLGNPAITAPIPGLIHLRQVDNAARAVKERRQLDLAESAQLKKAAAEMWANLPPGYGWLKNWEYV